jgi:type II secretory pathway pseudopilin PulG
MPFSSRSSQRGFTYLGLIILVTVIGMVGAATLKIGALMQRAQAEQDLLDIGAAFSDALQSYAAATPKGQPPQPPSLQELLKDPRTPALRRHLRKIFVDPATGSTEWGIVYQADKGAGGVVAVYSLSQARPLKIGNFDARFVGFDGKQHLSDWKFTAGAIAPVLPVAPVALAPQQSALFEPAARPAPLEAAARPAPVELAARPAPVELAAQPAPEAAAPPPETVPAPETRPAEPEEKADDNTAPPAEPKKEG